MFSKETIIGNQVVLEPLSLDHIEALVEAANEDPSLYNSTYVPLDNLSMSSYVDRALLDLQAGTAKPWTIFGKDDRQVKGMTRYFDIEKWQWPIDHIDYKEKGLDVCEIGYTWLRSSALRTAINTETKLLLLTHLFEDLQALRVCFKTDARNKRSQAAILRIGATFEGILRADRMSFDFICRDSYRYSIVRDDWPTVKENLEGMVKHYGIIIR